jgi:hypothetical protein
MQSHAFATTMESTNHISIRTIDGQKVAHTHARLYRHELPPFASTPYEVPRLVNNSALRDLGSFSKKS